METGFIPILEFREKPSFVAAYLLENNGERAVKALFNSPELIENMPKCDIIVYYYRISYAQWS
jgi:hypothetical protein